MNIMETETETKEKFPEVKLLKYYLPKIVSIPPTKTDLASSIVIYLCTYMQAYIYVTTIIRENETYSLRGRHGRGSRESNWEGLEEGNYVGSDIILFKLNTFKNYL